ncbi:cation-transporting P-type ATPase [Antarcticibacterium flavum]|uniref:Cation-transporting P-type ATPase n=1 Tax=Antarcticibacterium flavum TaxID=2058175 RepID=A0A5B7WZE0_9FLAO|nr:MULTISPECIES: cation-transporting P-type ATPase [Antarcticibacterium]MCM4161253.1 carbonate dehydratase [Antarcticibacterium sp. W02-3]QCY68430.1 cation-transporting P-type ATPase [Antarcticibacterium flavum]
MEKASQTSTGPTWHALTVEEIKERLGTDIKKGLTKEEISNRKEEYGRNELPQEKKQSELMRFLLQFNNLLIYILIIAAVITALMDHWIDTWVILLVVVLNAVIGYVQEGKAEEALAGIRNMLSLHAIVVRDGKQKEIEAVDLVPGDVVLLKSGDKVPADVRIVEEKDLQVEESPLTGEAQAVEKDTKPVDENTLLGDQTGMAFSGTTIVFGKARAVVVETGGRTEIGKINKMVSGVQKITTPLLQQIEDFSKWLSFVILGITAAFFAFGYFFRDYTISELFLASIGLVVAAIPEGLPAIMTITLAIGVQQMAKRKAIIRKLPSVETLGAVNVICSDKTGTLTRNEMTAKTVVTQEKVYNIEGTGYEPRGEIKIEGKEINIKEDKVFTRFMQCLRASNNSEISKNDEGNWEATGAPTEAALLSLSFKAGFEEFTPERLDTIPFESSYKFMATLNKLDDQKFIFMTGAPEQVMKKCSHNLTADGNKEIDRKQWEEKMDEIASRGQRILGAAFRPAEEQLNEINLPLEENDFIFLGVIGIIDPPREEVAKAIEECKTAGVKVKMITGDHALTATAIGREIGIEESENAITGQEIEEMSDEKLKEIVRSHGIYARTTPEHKLRLVKALQANGLLCAMTGDGVNDAPALKKANIGIAMGIKGTEVSKDASEMVLADDNFATIVNAIKEGRTVYDNIKKALFFILPTNGAESLVLMAAVFLGIVMPITPAQILWVNMVTAVTLALAISFEPMEKNVMKRPPRPNDQPILGKHFVWRIILVSLLIGALTLGVFYYMQETGLDLVGSRTVAVNTLVCCQLFYLFNCRRMKGPAISKDFFRNKYVFYAVGVLTLLQIFFVYTPFMNNFFDTRQLPLIYWLYPGLAGLLVFIIIEAEKFLTRKWWK